MCTVTRHLLCQCKDRLSRTVRLWTVKLYRTCTLYYSGWYVRGNVCSQRALAVQFLSTLFQPRFFLLTWYYLDILFRLAEFFVQTNDFKPQVRSRELLLNYCVGGSSHRTMRSSSFLRIIRGGKHHERNTNLSSKANLFFLPISFLTSHFDLLGSCCQGLL